MIIWKKTDKGFNSCETEKGELVGWYGPQRGGFAWKVYPYLNNHHFRVKQEKDGWCPTSSQARAMVEDNYINTFCDVCGDGLNAPGICRKCTNEINKSSIMGVIINAN